MLGLGIDYSMTCPAVCAYTPAGCQFWYAHQSKLPVLHAVDSYQITETHVIKRAVALAVQCSVWVLDRIEKFCYNQEVLCGIEDYAYNATGQVFQIGEHTGILKAQLWTEGRILLTQVPPNVIKKFATGKGNADKLMMTLAFLKAYPDAQAWIRAFFPRFTVETSPAKSPLSDLADAYWIARYTYHLTTGQHSS